MHPLLSRSCRIQKTVFTFLIHVICRNMIECHSLIRAATVDDENFGRSRTSKVRGAEFSPEILLPLFMQFVINRRSTWNQDMSVCHWTGVYCSSILPPVVSRIIVPTARLRGNITWKYLPQSVEVLRFPQNLLSGEIQLAYLTRHRGLRILSLECNLFSGSISLDALPYRLTEFNVSQNDLSGNLDFKHLPQTLVNLRLQHNRFSGGIELRSLPKGLRELDVSHNHLYGSLDFSSLATAECAHGLTLKLYKNQFSGVADCSPVPQSCIVQLWSNRITEYHPMDLPMNIQIDP